MRKNLLLVVVILLFGLLYGCDGSTVATKKALCAKGKFDPATGISSVDNKTVCTDESTGDGDNNSGTPPENGGGDGEVTPPEKDPTTLNPDGSIKEELIQPVKKDNKYYYYGRSLLKNADEIKLYDALLYRLLHFEENGSYGPPPGGGAIVMVDHQANLSLKDLNIKVKSADFKSVLVKVYKYVREDDARLYYTGQTPRYSFSDQYFDNGEWHIDKAYGTVHAWVTRGHYAAALKMMQTKIGQILSHVEPTMSEYEKIKVIHDEFLRTVSYSASDDANRSRLDGALIDGKALCEGYARTLVHLYQVAGIESVLIIGPALTSGTPGDPKPNDTWINHAWTKVKLEGNWYNIDSTWNDARITDKENDIYYDYFLMNDTKFSKSHKDPCTTYNYESVKVCPPTSPVNDYLSSQLQPLPKR